ncbi:MAG: hypothetical protein DSM106950_01335 [Stigonema ocellatum SAG 48.90 = DSM 106950]|nr:hypothetical protein [Stigonema ocellatum SAG 48.90 = DSM 106950]
MEVKDDSRARKTKYKQERQNGESKGNSGSVGVVPGAGGEAGDYQITASRANCKEPDSATTTGATQAPGGTIGQLIDEAQQQLAFHEEQLAFHGEQVEKVKIRIQQLSELSDMLRESLK